MDELQLAGKGLYFIFWGQILGFLLVVPSVGLFALLAAFGMILYGFYTAAKADAGYYKALILQLVYMIASILLRGIFKSGLFSIALDFAAEIISLAVIYLVCTTTARLVQYRNPQLAGRAQLIVKIEIAAFAAMIVCSLLAAVPLVNIVAGLIGWVAIAAQMIVSVIYLVFLWQAQKTLRA